MFGFVSRKEFEDLKTRYELTNRNLSGFMERVNNQLNKLEATLNCRDGKHEWGMITDIRNLGADTFTSNVVTGCKHCAIKKDEWEKHEQAEKHADEITDLYFKTRPKPQPKRKKGKK